VSRLLRYAGGIMITDNLNPHLKRALDHGVPEIDVLQGAIMTIMVEWQNKVFENKEWAEGYQDALSDIYTLCYDVIFYKQDMEKK